MRSGGGASGRRKRQVYKSQVTGIRNLKQIMFQSDDAAGATLNVFNRLQRKREKCITF